MGKEGVFAFACDEDGVTLSRHSCSNIDFAKSDITRMGHENEQSSRYPEGFRTVWEDKPPANWDGYGGHVPPHAPTCRPDEPRPISSLSAEEAEVMVNKFAGTTPETTPPAKINTDNDR